MVCHTNFREKRQKSRKLRILLLVEWKNALNGGRSKYRRWIRANKVLRILPFSFKNFLRILLENVFLRAKHNQKSQYEPLSKSQIICIEKIKAKKAVMVPYFAHGKLIFPLV